MERGKSNSNTGKLKVSKMLNLRERKERSLREENENESETFYGVEIKIRLFFQKLFDIKLFILIDPMKFVEPKYIMLIFSGVS